MVLACRTEQVVGNRAIVANEERRSAPVKGNGKGVEMALDSPEKCTLGTVGEGIGEQIAEVGRGEIRVRSSIGKNLETATVCQVGRVHGNGRGQVRWMSVRRLRPLRS